MTMPLTALTQACEDRDFVQWHRGCAWCAVWVLRLDVPAVQSLLAQARSHIAAHLLPRYDRQAHVTVAYRGLMASDGSETLAHAEFTLTDLRADIARLEAAAVRPFGLQLQGAGSFSTVPYLGVRAEAGLQALHRALTAHAAPYPGWEYVPHLTLGHYSDELPIVEVLGTLQTALPAQVLRQSTISDLWLARYRTSDIAGPLFFEGRWDLRTGMYQVQPDALWQL